MTKILRTLGIGLLLAMIAACGEDGPAAQWLQKTRRAHERADEALANDDRDAARRVLRRAAQAEVPASVAPRDARIVRQDLYYRLAHLELQAERPKRAQHWAGRGLALGRAQDLFTANLLVVRGRAREARGREVEAARDYHRALKINDRLLRRTLQGAKEKTP